MRLAEQVCRDPVCQKGELMDNRNFLVGAAIGAGLIYMLDPQSGGRRRALVRDKLVRASNVTRDAVDTTARDLANRSRGVVAATRARLSSADVADEVLVERIRAKLGRVCSHPHAIDVVVNDGHVALRGPVLAQEAWPIVSTVRAVRGVHSVTNELDLHESPEDVPSLQGEGRLAGPSLDVLQPNWAPATRALVAAAGLAATGFAVAAYTRRHAPTLSGSRALSV
jgi:hypothetical protein